MRNFFSAAVILLILLASCTKTYTTVNVTDEPYQPPFRVLGVTDVILEKTPYPFRPFFELPLQVRYFSGEGQRVSLQFSGIPQGIQHSFTVARGYPDFTTNASFLLDSAVNGMYPVTLSAQDDSGNVREYGMNVIVKGDTSCAGYLAIGSYSTVTYCDAGEAYTTTITKNGYGGDTMFINNFRNQHLTLMCKIDCQTLSSNTWNIEVPNQTINGSMYYGGGKMEPGRYGRGVDILMNILKVDSGNTTRIPCSCTMIRN